MHVHVYACMFVHRMHAVPVEERKESQILWNWSFRQL